MALNKIFITLCLFVALIATVLSAPVKDKSLQVDEARIAEVYPVQGSVSIDTAVKEAGPEEDIDLDNLEDEEEEDEDELDDIAE